jgi:hypothetical protein
MNLKEIPYQMQLLFQPKLVLLKFIPGLKAAQIPIHGTEMGQGTLLGLVTLSCLLLTRSLQTSHFVQGL